MNLENYKQEQLLRFYNELNESEKQELITDLKKIDYDMMNTLYINSYTDEVIDVDKVSNLKIVLEDLNNEDYKNLGEEVVKNGKYAVLLMAAGDGTRLGINKPKGCLELNINGKMISIFELYIRSIKKASLEYNAKIKVYVMTSTKNDKEIREFFDLNNYFGYDKENIEFFYQGNLPILDIKGKIVLKDKSHVLFGPQGNGDVFETLKKSNLIEDMEKNNIEFVLFTTIDNVITNLVDTRFIGATIKNNYGLSSKTLTKKEGSERDWIFCKYYDKPFMLPTAYITEEITNKKEGDLYLYREKNITYHLISLENIKKFSNVNLKYHRAYKRNEFLDEDGFKIISETPNSFKFEKFIFDAFYFADDMLLYRVDENSFCPIKSKDDINKALEILNKRIPF